MSTETSSTELDTRLADLRREPEWPAAARAAVLENILATPRDAQPHDRRLVIAYRRRRTAAVAAVVGLAAAAAVAIPAVLPSGSPGSVAEAHAVAALRQLAHIAAVSPADDLGPGQYVHIVDIGSQSATPGQDASRSHFEYWIRSDGQTYELRQSTGNGPSEDEVWLLPPGPSLIDGMDEPQQLDQLPTDPAALETYLRAHTTGSTSADERVFVADVDIVRRGLASSQLRSAAIEVLARLGHVRLGDQTRDSMGNPVQAFEFVDPQGRPDEVRTIMFDTRTAQITEDRDVLQGKIDYVETVPTFEVVDSVPAAIRERAVLQK